jgi:hypothetical protein
MEQRNMGTKTKTAAEVQAEIAALQQEQQQLQQDLLNIEQQIADNWNGDNSKLETEYSAKQARLKASGRVLERLQNDLTAASKADMLKQYRQRVKDYFPVETAAIEARAKVKTLEEQLEAARKEYQQKQDRDDLMRSGVNFVYPIPAQYRNAGITGEEFEAIYAEERVKYEQSLEKAKTQ